MTVTNKWLLISKSHSDSNWCTPHRGKHDQHATCFPCSAHESPIVLDSVTALMRSTHSNPSRVTDSVGQSHCSREKGLPTQSTVHRLTVPRVRTQFLSRANQWSSGESQIYINNWLLGLPGTYHRHAIGMFNTCSRGPTHRSSTDTGRGYNLRGASLPHTTPRPSQPAVSTFP
jgi:hypothetical protein